VKVVVGELLPLALVVTIWPINVIPVILSLFKRPLINAPCFLVGFIARVAALLVAFVAVAGVVDLSSGSGIRPGRAF
jgi:hypothetical protein